MIDFACKQFKLKEVVKCALGLTRSDFSILEYFMNETHKQCTTETIAKRLNLDLTTVQRGVKKLYEKGVLDRLQNNLDNGGYIFVYEIKSKKVMRKIILDIVKKWVKAVEGSLEKW